MAALGAALGPPLDALGALLASLEDPRAGRTAHRGPKNDPRPPTEAQEVMGRSPTLLQDDFEIIGHTVTGRSPTILQDDFEIASHRKTAYVGPRSSKRLFNLTTDQLSKI